MPIDTSIKLILAEYKRLSAENNRFRKEYQKAESELKVASAIYDEVVFRDRYYVRFIYTSALLNLFSNNLLDAEHLLLKAETLSRNNYDKATVLYYKSILDLLQNNDIKATELSERAAQIFSKIYSCIEQVEALIINAISKRSNQTIEIQPEHFDWYQYVFNLYTNHLIKTINGNQNIGEWRLDTDSTKKHLFIYYKK